ncbi:hypothetical protein GCM10007301_34910 [Azorhizobium oxalatiphilum]|uniref:Uncharacterized protein n=1 Tax=Azorhizobium oxalatiphilum TaxID=980631 RepID=A0A917FF74_9HYPH|nr:hypothetical protein GCM10007301_34910 [Azorhizobium oxalatiphilum]
MTCSSSDSGAARRSVSVRTVAKAASRRARGSRLSVSRGKGAGGAGGVLRSGLGAIWRSLLFYLRVSSN